jgi:hypothetical protein
MRLSEARKEFKLYVQPYVVERYGSKDIPALNLAFNEWIDSLYQDGIITERQVMTWTRD